MVKISSQGSGTTCPQQPMAWLAYRYKQRRQVSRAPCQHSPTRRADNRPGQSQQPIACRAFLMANKGPGFPSSLLAGRKRSKQLSFRARTIANNIVLPYPLCIYLHVNVLSCLEWTDNIGSLVGPLGAGM